MSQIPRPPRRSLKYIIPALILAAIFLIVYSSSPLFFAEEHYVGTAPDGWYSQREGISLYQVSDGHLFLPRCEHSYLGPLHGDWKLAPSINITRSGWYNLRLENNTIVEAVLRKESDGSW